MGKSYRDLVAWQKAMDLVMEIYRITASFPREEIYGLTSQLRRAAVSVPSNIAEGQGRRGVAEFRHFLRQASGSLMELETQVLIAERLCNTDPETAVEVLRDAAERGKILNGLLSSLQ
ncbi:MAG TPA: four helix bundle protein [Candidatus Binatia bacterium]|nr:four helix bundle protein [Candidatus Binatia bacterium]